MVLPLRALRVLGGEAFVQQPRRSPRDTKDMSWRFPFVRFGSLVVKPLCSGLINVILMRGQ